MANKTPETVAKKILAQGGQILLPFHPDESDTQIVFVRSQLFKLIVEALNE